ncbi:DUF1800 domain-containing protein [Qipengyuania sp. 1NDH17]|uniref:DUF1800 domain-containing protein n=1 Tax=Qipengyuania polymorpha TaxID=2867234 RepID=A0ABS7IX63_9SPHN|nr:DUF1800 domain-containing protein [Qipengyuania polymorpha]MBX7456870.1 DUF1800 domain-containing protein [Qipengyuania polymorpha]
MTPTAIALNRFGLGYRRGDALPRDARGWLLGQIENYDPAPPALGDAKYAAEDIRALIEQASDIQSDLRDAQEMGGDKADEIRAMRQDLAKEQRQGFVGDVALRARLALESDTPFMERMVHFWANHFAVSSDKDRMKALVGPHEFGAIRPHVTGNFSDMLRAAALHPAMLAYLDQFRSQGPNSDAERRRERRGGPSRGLNENLGREILELHTLGVGGGYTQEDVKELARALTGWTLQGLPYAKAAVPQPGGGAFFAFIHEPGERVILGQRYADTGAEQAFAILDDLAQHPSTARFIATKLARHFTGDTPPQTLVDRLAESFTESGGHLPTLYRTLVGSEEVWADEPLKFRTPWDWSLAMLRAGGEPRLADRKFAIMLRELGQEAWTPGSPAGWDDRDASWTGANALLRKVEAAERFAGAARLEDVRELAETMLPGSLSQTTRAIIAGAESNEMGFALLMASPEMLRR